MTRRDNAEDVLAPKEFIVPVISGTIANQPIMSGALFFSGAKLYFEMSGYHLVTSS